MTAAIFSGSGRIPPLPTMWPRNLIVLRLNLHLLGFAYSRALRRIPRTARMCSSCSSGDLEKISISSKYTTTNLFRMGANSLFITA